LGSWLPATAFLSETELVLRAASNRGELPGGLTTPGSSISRMRRIQGSFFFPSRAASGRSHKNFCEKGGKIRAPQLHHSQNQRISKKGRQGLLQLNAGLRVYDISDPYLRERLPTMCRRTTEERRDPFQRHWWPVRGRARDKRGYCYMMDRITGSIFPLHGLISLRPSSPLPRFSPYLRNALCLTYKHSVSWDTGYYYNLKEIDSLSLCRQSWYFSNVL